MLKKLVVVLFLLLGAGILLAADVVERYTNLRSGGYRETVAVVDSASVSGTIISAKPYFKISNGQNIRVSALFTDANATLKIHFIRGSEFVDTFVASPSKTSGTFTAGAYFTMRNGSTDYYMADDLIFDAGSYNAGQIVWEAPSAGTVILFVTVY